MTRYGGVSTEGLYLGGSVFELNLTKWQILPFSNLADDSCVTLELQIVELHALCRQGGVRDEVGDGTRGLYQLDMVGYPLWLAVCVGKLARGG